MPPYYDAAVDDELMPSACKAHMDDVGVGYQFVLVSEAFADEGIAQQPRQLGRVPHILRAAYLFHGINSSMRLIGWPSAILASVSRR